MVMSNVVTFFFNKPSRTFLRFSRIFLMTTPCFRNVTFAKAILRAGNSPLIFAPFRSIPSYAKVGIICAFLAAMIVILFINFIH
jgi:hypothetical protein